MIQKQIIQFISDASQSAAKALNVLYNGVMEVNIEWLAEECDPTQHMTDLLHVLDTVSVAGLHFLYCGCITFLTNETVYISFCGKQHQPMTNAEIAEKLVDYSPLHYVNINEHPIPFGIDGETIHPPEKALLDLIKWELFQDTVKDVQFDFEGGHDGR